MQIFARITKVDEATGKVWGRAVMEEVDRSGEIFDYESSKPNFIKWSEAVAKATDGKSVGNLRAMHGKIAAGKLFEITFNDAEKAIDIGTEVVDPVEREKCVKGVYTGFSIGGRYAKKWDDAVQKGVTRYTADPNEISLVDLPCGPSAQFTVVKSDGAEELRKFETTLDNSEALAKWIDALDESVRAVILAKLAPTTAAAAADPVAKDFTAQAERLAKNDAAETAGNVLRVLLDLPPIEKGLWSVADFAGVLSQLACITDCADDEAAWEGDGSKVPAQLRAALKPLADAFLAMAAEEVNEAIKPATEEVIVLELAASGDLAKSLGIADSAGALEKVSALAADLAKAQGDLAAAADSLTKMTEERDGALAKVAELTKQYADWLKQPAAPKGAAKVVTVEKTVGIEEAPINIDNEPVKKADGSIDHIATAQKMAKAAYASPRIGH